ncbi:Nacht and ankyrin domain protein [Colletotrichum higginsianum IMI 349063]|uniref:Nacht and ankyrin domain protein n=1 Tax=Colletotrichum higginsianum (strain IMI 349063) TaxID=759273 RepID=A0A1B7XQC6_COLHI|nr:Nacht and ankyrin domain protein [Colletotrichum higginsianum IMI 349063]OBR01951.1 Nacht and ankyrin domain protein [Colletotrichum higginsianum IMI 349063]
MALWQYGTTNAASVINHMIRTFTNLRFCLMVGIGGGVPTKRDIRLGDVVVSAPDHGRGGVYEYDYGKTLQNKAFEPTGALNQPPLELLVAANALRAEYEFKGMSFVEQIAAKVQRLSPDVHSKYSRPRNDRLYMPNVIHDDQSRKTPCCQNLDESPKDESSLLVRRPARHSEEPIIHYGLIASGNKLMKNAETRDVLAKNHDILCFEMEAAGLMNQFPTLVVRGICDYSDSHKNSEWQGFAALAAALYARDLLLEIAPTTAENSERLREQR